MLVKILRLDTAAEADSDLHCTSHFLSEPAQLAFRALALGYCLSTLFSSFVYNLSFTFFTFFTYLSYILLTIYFGVIVFLSVRYNNPSRVLSPKQLCAANVLLEIVATNALFLDIVYWTLLYSSSSGMNTMQYYICVNVHLVNLLIILTEVFTNKFHFEPRHVFFTVSVLTIYTCFSIVYYLLSHNWVYPILDWNNPKAPIYYTACFVLNVTCFFVMNGIYRLRERVAAKRRGGFESIESIESGFVPIPSAVANVSSRFTNTERRFSNISSHSSYGTAGPVFPKVTAVIAEVTPIKSTDNAVMTEVKTVSYVGDLTPMEKPLPMYPMVYPAMAGGAAM